MILKHFINDKPIIGETKTHSSTRKDKSNFSNIKGGK